MVAPASERSVPCGVCQGQVPESHFRSGRARLYQEVLYCATCTSEAEKARVETAAFKQSLTKGFYACAKCEAPMASKDIEANTVVFFQGNLYCRECSRDLRGILRPNGGPPPSSGGTPPVTPMRQSAVFNSQSSGMGAGASPSRRLSPSQVSTVSGMGTVSGRQAPVGPPCHLCDKPAVAVAGQPLPLEYQGNIYCGACRREIDSMLARSNEDLARISTFECQRCRTTVRARDVIEGRAVRFRGQILCAPCSKDVGGRSGSQLEVPTVGAKKPVPVAPPPTAPCARCERMIPGLDIRLGKVLERDGKIFCVKCKVDLEAARELRERKAAKAVICAHCGRAISAKEIKDRKITYHLGQHYCFGCSRDPAKILLGHSSDEAAVGACRMCGAAIAPGARGECATCQAKVQKLQEESLAKSGEMAAAGATSALSYPCDGAGCQNSITEQDLEAGRAVIAGDKSLCPACAAKLKPKKAPARCARCRKVLEEGAAPGSFCGTCAEKSADDAADMEAALKLSSEFTLRCSQCQRAIGADELENGKAVTVQGKLQCGNCRYKQGAKPAAAAAAKKVCATCDGALQGAGVPYGDKRICATCQGVLENLLAASQMPATVTAPCKACKKQAKGEGALLIDKQPFCKACRRAADFLILYTIRAQRTGGARGGSGSKLPVLVAVGTALAIFVLAWGFISNRDKNAVVVVKPPEKKTKDDAPPELPALSRALQLVSTQPKNYQQAQERVEQVQKLQQEAKGPDMDGVLARAIAARNAFAFGLAMESINKAEACARQNKLDEAVQTLGKFPPELLETDAGRDVGRLRDKLVAQATCTREATRLLLPGGAPERYQDMERLLSSPGAGLCNFADSAQGKQLAAEARVLRNEVLAKNNGLIDQQGKMPVGEAIAKGLDAEKKHTLGTADDYFARALDSEPANTDAIAGRARVAWEQDKPRATADLVDRLKSLANKRADVRILEGWLALTGFDPKGHELAKKLMAGLTSPRDLGSSGKALRALLDLGPPFAVGARLTFLGDPDETLVSAGEMAAEKCIQILGVPRGDDRLLVVHFKSESAKNNFVSSLGRSPSDDDRVAGCLSVVLVSPGTTKLAQTVVKALAARTSSPPAWIVAALPLVLRRDMPAAPADYKDPTIAELESESLSSLAGNPARLYGAYKRVASALDNGKTNALSTYVTNRRIDAKKARAELEASLTGLR